ncbi:nuclear transport factor 2 family protein [Longimicrobium sp.]|uniref:nuclear transport factor 2 family protein n=1 Tax=Longimicrobium sp. TaxID=2029185 RepID=UPI002CF41636|nr:nuclear transport factor 2 family protein [Longimicrobium sp.]HSU16912.1 nuclear transport factor 2 family protein [Longimicrobium sp.]
MTSSTVDTVHAWITAVNAGDADAAVVVTSPDVAIVGPRGTARGHAVLRAWLAHAGATFATRAVYVHGDCVVVAQHGVWRDAETGAVKGEADVATRFRVEAGRVAEMERYGDLPAALAAAGLSEADAAGDGGS